MAAAPAQYGHGAAHLLPRTQRPEARRVMDSVGHTLGGWFVGQFLDMLIVGALCGAGLVLLGMPLACILAVIAGLTNVVPSVGAIAGAVPAVLIAVSLGGQEALWVSLLCLAVQTLKGNVIGPLVQRRAIALPPALTLVSQTAPGLLFGLFGAVLAAPFTAAVIVPVQTPTQEHPDC